MARKIAVIGIGNLLLRDEGLGVHVVGELNKRRLPDNVEVHDCGTGGLSILDLLTDFDKVIVVDAVKRGGEPGTVYRFRLDEREVGDKLGKMVSLHELDLATVMKIGRETRKLPNEILVIGIEPKAIELGLDLSPEVEKSVPEVVRLILEELK